MKRKSEDPIFDVEKVASVTECTGLIPSLPQSESEDENYARLYATHSAKGTRKEQYRKK